MFERLVGFLARIWSVNDSGRLPENVDLIALVSIGATPTRLTNGAVGTCKVVQGFLTRYPEADVVFGGFTGNGEHTIEEEIKSKLFPDGVCVGKVLSTIMECLAFKARFPEAKSIIFVTEEAHSRRAKIVWQTLWPEADIYIVPVPIAETVDSESPMKPYHKTWTALFWQAMPTPYFLYLALRGREYMVGKAHFHQPIVK